MYWFGDRNSALKKELNVVVQHQFWKRIIAMTIGTLTLWACMGCSVDDKSSELSTHEKEERSLKFHTAGIRKAVNGNYVDAIVDYDQALALSPNNSEILYNRAVAHYSVGDVEKALQDLERTIALDSTMAQAYANRGVIRLELRDIKGAHSDGQKAAALFDAQGEHGLAVAIRMWLKQEVRVREVPQNSSD